MTISFPRCILDYLILIYEIFCTLFPMMVVIILSYYLTVIEYLHICEHFNCSEGYAVIDTYLRHPGSPAEGRRGKNSVNVVSPTMEDIEESQLMMCCTAWVWRFSGKHVLKNQTNRSNQRAMRGVTTSGFATNYIRIGLGEDEWTKHIEITLRGCLASLIRLPLSTQALKQPTFSIYLINLSLTNTKTRKHVCNLHGV